MKSITASVAAFAAVVCCVVGLGAQAENVVYEVPSIDYQQQPNINLVRNVLATEGLIAVTNVPNLRLAREQALVAAGKCVLEHNQKAAPVSLLLKDSTERFSWAGFTSLASGREPMDVVSNDNCPGLQDKMNDLRQVVDVGSQFFANVLDQAIKVDEFDLGLLERRGGAGNNDQQSPRPSSSSYSTFNEIVTKARNLDHFHVYKKTVVSSSKPNEEEPTLALHTDQGLFIAIVPSVRLSKSGSAKQQQQDDDDASFYIQLSNGRKAHVKLPSNGNCLLFMIGDGSNYLLPNSHFPVRPVPHGLALESSPSEDVVRVWFGRMFFAPNDAILTDKMPTFDGMMQLAVESRRLNENFPVLSCGPSSTQQQTQPQPRALHDVSGHNCSRGLLIVGWHAVH
jgi:hypothetical protein